MKMQKWSCLLSTRDNQLKSAPGLQQQRRTTMNHSEHSDQDECNSVQLETPSRLLNLPNLEQAKHKRSASFTGPIGLDNKRFDPANEKVLLSDLLIKTNPYNCRKSKRYFVLTESRLMYYTNEKSFRLDQPFKRSYWLDNSSFEWTNSSISVMSFILSSTGRSRKTQKRRIIFNSQKQAREWLKKLNSLKNYEIKRAKSLPVTSTDTKPSRLMATENCKIEPIVIESESDMHELFSIIEESKEESGSSPEPIVKVSSKKAPLGSQVKKGARSIDQYRDEEEQEKKTPYFNMKALEYRAEHGLESELISSSQSRNEWSPRSKFDSFPLELSKIKSKENTYSDGTESLKYFALHSTIQREEQEHLSQNIRDSMQEGIASPPHAFPSLKIFEFLALLSEYQLKVSKEDLHSIVKSLKKSSSRNGLLSGIQSLRSSLEMLHQKFKDPTQASTRREYEPSPQFIRMEDGTVLQVEQNIHTRDKTLKVVRSRQGTNGLAVCSSLDEVDEDEEQVVQWADYLHNLHDLGNDVILVHYSEKMLDKIIENSINDPETNSLNTSGPRCVFSRMQENLQCVNNYSNKENNDVLWVNMSIFWDLISRQVLLANTVIEQALVYFDRAQKFDLEAREYHLSGLLINDMEITVNLFQNFADAFLRLRSDSGNYSFLHSFLMNHYMNKFEGNFTPEYLTREARKWVGGIIFKPQMVETVIACVHDQLSSYFVMQKKLVYLRLICEKQVSELVPVLTMNFDSMDELIAEGERRFMRTKKKVISDKFIL